MATLTIRTRSGKSEIYIGKSLRKLAQHINPDKTILICDKKVHGLYSVALPSCPVIEVADGENSKTLDTINSIYRQLIEFRADRDTRLVGIGGGVISDITGFAAATFMRGLAFAFVPSTLLAQVDASIGGKNGVNFLGYKNMIGTIRQPEFIICDPVLLKSLPLKEIRNGLAEIVKSALIGDERLFNTIEDQVEKLLQADATVLQPVIRDTIRVKKRFVEEDEFETGTRRILNFGHTFGHALESVKKVSHGEAVSIGMALALRLSQSRGLISSRLVERTIKLLHHFGLPSTISGICGDGLINALTKDKKRAGSVIKFILISGIGKPKIVEIPPEELKEYFDDLSQSG